VSEKTSWSGLRTQILVQLGVPFDVPWNQLGKRQRELVLHGAGERKFKVKWAGKKGGEATFVMDWEGVLPRLMRRFRESTSESAKRWYAQFLADSACSTCRGTRLRAESAAVRFAKRTIVEISALTIDDARAFFAGLRLEGAAQKIAAELLKEIRGRLDFLAAVGLGYLSLDRAGPSLSGGESQRIGSRRRSAPSSPVSSTSSTSPRSACTHATTSACSRRCCTCATSGTPSSSSNTTRRRSAAPTG
jgi:excinuclease ABC subunit A